MNKTAEKQSIWRKTFVSEWVNGDQLTESVRLFQKPGYCHNIQELLHQPPNLCHTYWINIYDRSTPCTIILHNYIFYILPHIIILDAIPSDTSLWFTSITLKVKLLFLQILKHALCQCYQSTRKLVLFTCQSQFSLSFGTWWVLILDPVGNAIVNHKFYITRFLWDFKNCIRLYVNCNETLQMQNSAFNSRPTYSNE